MPAETVDQKAARIAEAGQVVHVAVIDPHDGVDRWAVTGDNGQYEVLTATDPGDATCTCPAKRACAHIAAVHIAIAEHAPVTAAIVDEATGEILDDEPPEPVTATELATTGSATLAAAQADVARDRLIYGQLAAICKTDFVPRHYRNKPMAAGRRTGSTRWSLSARST